MIQAPHVTAAYLQLIYHIKVVPSTNAKSDVYHVAYLVLVFVFCVLCFVFCVLSFVFCVLCFVLMLVLVLVLMLALVVWAVRAKNAATSHTNLQ
jgi:hypothetical protein